MKMDQNKCCKQNFNRERISLWPEACSYGQSNNVTRITTERNWLCIYLQCRCTVLVNILH